MKLMGDVVWVCLSRGKLQPSWQMLFVLLISSSDFSFFFDLLRSKRLAPLNLVKYTRGSGFSTLKSLPQTFSLHIKLIFGRSW